ncbi:MAG: polyisoprenoid-binding protein [Polyangiaceae bacterium]|nr:polyisoprenoid-binding protein [Polyangiaceae bacterium]MCW5792071.1 polyisoprenoid-binding protein [Polyangiaceae bacterium]
MTWAIDKTHSQVSFSVKHMMISTVHGRFTSFDAQVELDPSALSAAKVRADVDVNSIDTSEPQRDAHLKSADFFDAERFPKLSFESTRVEAQGSKLSVTGNLTIRDKTAEVTLTGEIEGPAKDPWGKERIGFSLSGQLEREAFGLGWNQVLEAGGVLVGKKVTLSIEAQIVKQ